MRTCLLLCFALTTGAALPTGPGVAAQERPAPTWEALRARPFPEWFLDAKLGIFIHWGVYSVPAYSGKEDYAEWFYRGLQLGDTLRTRFLRENYGPEFHYRDFAPLFRAELFDPAAWAELFRQAGARYVVLVSKHHDGYALWPSRYSPPWTYLEPGPEGTGVEIVPKRTDADWVPEARDPKTGDPEAGDPDAEYPGAKNPDAGARWNSAEVGPKRDLVGDLTEAVRDAGLHMGLYYSLAEWSNPLHRWYTDPPDSIGRYVDAYMVPQFKELVSRYRPEVIFADGEWLNTAEQWHARELIGWYFDTVGPDAVVNDRWGQGSDVGFKTPEYSAGLQLTHRPWAEVRGLGRSFGLNRNEKLEAYLTPEELVHAFARAVAAGGGMILNVGPGADGQIPLLQQERLLQLGEWLRVNGEAIYGSRTWVKSGESREVSLERIDPNIDFDWVRNGPGRPIREDDFTATWTGYLEAPATGPYRFEAEADDGVRVWVEGTAVAASGFEAAAGAAAGAAMATTAAAAGAAAEAGAAAAGAGAPGTEEPPALALEAGVRYPVRVEYREEDLNASVRLYWRREEGGREIIPPSAFFTGPGPEASPGLRARYASLQETLAYTRNGDDLYIISFQWPDRALAVPIPEPPAGTRITLLGREGALPWTYEDGSLEIDVSGVPHSRVPGDWAWTLRLEGYVGGERGAAR